MMGRSRTCRPRGEEPTRPPPLSNRTCTSQSLVLTTTATTAPAGILTRHHQVPRRDAQRRAPVHHERVLCARGTREVCSRVGGYARQGLFCRHFCGWRFVCSVWCVL